MADEDDKAPPVQRTLPKGSRLLFRPSARGARSPSEPYSQPHNRPHVHEGHSHSHSHSDEPPPAPTAHWSEPSSGVRAPVLSQPPSRVVAPLELGRHEGRALHFDCFSGLSGDMIVGALLDLGVPLEALERALAALPLKGFRVRVAGAMASSIGATRFIVEVDGPQPYRTWRQIRALLEQAELTRGTRDRALAAFDALARAEARIHRISPEDVHFHEVGAVDAIVDIVCASAALEHLSARLTCAPLPLGHGFAQTEHGTIPLPAPAVVELLAGIPTVQAGIPFELVTPTGAAIVRANASAFERWPAIEPARTGFGAGTRALPDRPNLLRAIYGHASEPRSEPASAHRAGTHTLLESNIDDAPGELLAHATSALLREGALDAWTESIGMKKSRPAVKLCALCREQDADRLAAVMLREAPTLGVRMIACERRERPRRELVIETEYGPVPCKIADGDGLPRSAKPEDDALAALAARAGVPVRVVRDAALAALARGPIEPAEPRR